MCLALKVSCAHFQTKSTEVNESYQCAQSLKISPPLGYGCSNYKSSCASTVYNKQWYWACGMCDRISTQSYCQQQRNRAPGFTCFSCLPGGKWQQGAGGDLWKVNREVSHERRFRGQMAQEIKNQTKQNTTRFYVSPINWEYKAHYLNIKVAEVLVL